MDGEISLCYGQTIIYPRQKEIGISNSMKHFGTHMYI